MTSYLLHTCAKLFMFTVAICIHMPTCVFLLFAVLTRACWIYCNSWRLHKASATAASIFSEANGCRDRSCTPKANPWQTGAVWCIPLASYMHYLPSYHKLNIHVSNYVNTLSRCCCCYLDNDCVDVAYGTAENALMRCLAPLSVADNPSNTPLYFRVLMNRAPDDVRLDTSFMNNNNNQC